MRPVRRGIVHPGRSACGPHGLGVSRGLLACSFQVIWSDMTRRSEILVITGQICPQLDLLQSVYGKFLYLAQLFPMREQAVSLPMVDDVVCRVFGDPWKLGKLTDSRCIDVDFVPVLYCHECS